MLILGAPWSAVACQLPALEGYLRELMAARAPEVAQLEEWVVVSYAWCAGTMVPFFGS